YYGTSIRYAVEWIAANADTLMKGPFGKIRVRCYYGDQECALHFIQKYPQLQHVKVFESSNDWEYSIIQPVEAKWDSTLLTNWPPKNVIHEIKINGAPIIAIARNAHKDLRNELYTIPIFTNDNVNALLDLSLKFYQLGDYFSCIAACERVLVLDPDNTIALNNIGSSFNSLSLFYEAIPYINKALKINPDFKLANGNLQVALDGKKQPHQ